MYKLFQSYQRMREVSESGGDLYIRCAGSVGRHLLHELRRIGFSISAFLDTDYMERRVFEGIPVLDPREIMNKERNRFFLMIAVDRNDVYEEIVKECENYGLELCVDYADFSIDGDRRMMNYLDIDVEGDAYAIFQKSAKARIQEMRKIDPTFKGEIPKDSILIPNLDVPLTTFCSLQCEFCSHCIPYAHPPKHFNAEEIIRDLEIVTAVSHVVCMAIMGGEPFVYPNIREFIGLYKNAGIDKRVSFTRLVTNGTVVPDKDFFEEYKKLDNAYIYISNYGEKSKKLNELVKECEKYQVPYFVCPESADWMLLGDFKYKRNYTTAQLKHLFAVCGAHSCVQLLNGRIYTCSRIPLLNEEGLIPYSERDFCDIRRLPKDLLQDKLSKYLYQTDFLEGCQYCDGQHMYSKMIHRGE